MAAISVSLGFLWSLWSILHFLFSSLALLQCILGAFSQEMVQLFYKTVILPGSSLNALNDYQRLSTLTPGLWTFGIVQVKTPISFFSLVEIFSLCMCPVLSKNLRGPMCGFLEIFLFIHFFSPFIRERGSEHEQE